MPNRLARPTGPRSRLARGAASIAVTGALLAGSAALPPASRAAQDEKVGGTVIPMPPTGDPPSVLPPDTPGTEPAREVERNQWQYIVIHHSASPSGNAAAFDRQHRAKGWDGLAYHFVIDNGRGGGDGQLEVGQRWWKQKHGAHAGALRYGMPADFRNAYNEFGIGVCLVGNLEQRAPTRAQMATLAKLVLRLQNDFLIGSDDIVGHGQVKQTACPGRLFPWRTLSAMLDEQPCAHYPRTPTCTVHRCPWCCRQPGMGHHPEPRPKVPQPETPDLPPSQPPGQ